MYYSIKLYVFQLIELSLEMATAVLESPGSRLPCTPVNFVSPVLRRRGLLDAGVSSKKSPLAQTSTANTMLEVNDDEAEKRERRLSKALEMQQQLLVSPVVQSARCQLHFCCSQFLLQFIWFLQCSTFTGNQVR